MSLEYSKSKYWYGDIVKVKEELSPIMSHFLKNREGIIQEITENENGFEYILIWKDGFVEGWYFESDLIMITPNIKAREWSDKK